MSAKVNPINAKLAKRSGTEIGLTSNHIPVYHAIDLDLSIVTLQ